MLCIGLVAGRQYLREQGQDGDARMAADDGDVHVLHVQAGLLGVKGPGTHLANGKTANQITSDPPLSHQTL